MDKNSCILDSGNSLDMSLAQSESAGQQQHFEHSSRIALLYLQTSVLQNLHQIRPATTSYRKMIDSTDHFCHQFRPLVSTCVSIIQVDRSGAQCQRIDSEYAIEHLSAMTKGLVVAEIRELEMRLGAVDCPVLAQNDHPSRYQPT